MKQRYLAIFLFFIFTFRFFGISITLAVADYQLKLSETYRQFLINLINLLLDYIKILQEKIAKLKLKENFSQNGKFQKIQQVPLDFGNNLTGVAGNSGGNAENNIGGGSGGIGGDEDAGSEGSFGSRGENVYRYDIVVVGAGTGGVMASIQAARLGMKVALVEETDWIGGQSTAAGVGSTDGGRYVTFGLFREFVDRVKNFYQSRGKSTGTCWAQPCYEPAVAQQVFKEMLAEAALSTPTSALDVFTLEKVIQVFREGNTVVGLQTETGKKFMAKIIIDATEYGDVIPLTGARYRIGNTTSDNYNSSACIQDITYTAIIKKYPDGLPLGFYMATPPGPSTGSSSYAARREAFEQIVASNGSEGFPINYPVNFPFHNTYRGTPDLSNSQNYEFNSSNPETFRLISKTSVNWANDYPSPRPYISSSEDSVLSVNYLDNLEARKNLNCEAKLKTLQFVYYIQHELGEPLWSIANDQGYDGFYNTEKNDCPNIDSAYKILEKNMPVIPYVRESRRLMGIYTLVGSDIKRTRPFRDFYLPAKHFPTSVAVGDYGMDQHNCKSSTTLEIGLDSPADKQGDARRGPFAIPFEVFVPETIDGFLVAEKNLSMSRLAQSASRLHSVTMNTGQAVGAIAALAIKENVQPRHLNPAKVQKVLLDNKAKISYYIFSDVSTTHQFWKAVEFVSVRGLMVGFADGRFGINDFLRRDEAAAIIAKLANLDVSYPPADSVFEDVSLNDPAYPYIEAIYKAGITKGCSLSPLKYCPDSFITRAQFATFLARALNFDVSSVSNEPHFADVSLDSPYFKYVQYLYEQGITKGCATNPAKFCPNDNITKGQAAAFVANSLWK